MLEPINNNASSVFPASAWQVLHLKPRCEKKMHTYLAALNIENYLPLRVERKIYQRRKVQVELPLFPSYIFAQFAYEQRVTVLKSQLVVRILPGSDHSRLSTEIDQIRRALEVNPGLQACSGLKRGVQVKIIAGPLRGVEGIVRVIKGATRVVLTVESIGQGVAVDVDPAMLERV